jgi:hypothetical protein
MTDHHAFLYLERSPEVREEITTGLKARGAVTLFTRTAWGIDDSRALADEAQRTDMGGSERVFIIEATSLTVEAQNALLKLFEEPPRNVSFHCFFAAGAALLPTLLSRLSVVAGQLVGGGDAGEVFKAWQLLPIAEQLSEIELRTKNKDQVWIEAIKQGALSHVAPKMASVPPPAAERLYFALTTIGTRGASNKMLLEEVALTLGSVPSLAKTR